MNSKPTQRDRVLQYLHDFGSITAVQALRDLGVHRLAARVLELRLGGHDIETELVAVNNRYGESVNVARYTLRNSRQSRLQGSPTAAADAVMAGGMLF
jgi:predicted ABC-type ATPase